MNTARLLASVLFASTLAAQSRPKILGVADMAIYVTDVQKARIFYEQMLGLGETFTVPKHDGSGPRTIFMKVNDRQYVELYNEPNPGHDGRLHHISFWVESADQMFAFLKSRGMEIPENARSAGKSLPQNALSSHIGHVGFSVGDLEKSAAFYSGTLGFIARPKSSTGST